MMSPPIVRTKKRPRAPSKLGLLGLAACGSLPVAAAASFDVLRWSGRRGLAKDGSTNSSVSSTSSSFNDSSDTSDVVSSAVGSASATATSFGPTVISASSSASATFTSDGPDDDLGTEVGSNDTSDDDCDDDCDDNDDDDSGDGERAVDDDSEESADDDLESSSRSAVPGSDVDKGSSMEVLTPTRGEDLTPSDSVEITWTPIEGTQFEVDLYHCGDDESCEDTCGEFVERLCAQGGGYSTTSSLWVEVPEKADGTGPYFKMAVSTADGDAGMGCSDAFTIADSEGNEGESDDDGDDDVDDDADESPDKSSSESDMVLESCEGLDDIPHPLERDFQVAVGIGVSEIACVTTKTVMVGGGTLTIATEEETVVFSGVRFKVESGASLAFSADTATEFTGVVGLESDGGVFNVAAGGSVGMVGEATFRSNSVQSTREGPCNGAAIFNQGTVRLRGGATFTNNFVYANRDGEGTGNGGAVWNGATGRTIFDSAATLDNNGVGSGGRGGALWNEGFVEFRGATLFQSNLASSSGEGESDEGGGGGMFNQGGLVRFKEEAAFCTNEAQAGSAFVNAAGGRVMLQEETSIDGNVSLEEESSIAGAVWNQADSLLSAKKAISWDGNRGYNAAGMLNYGKAVFRGELSVRDNTAVMDGGGFINESGAAMVFYKGAEFLTNVGTGYGGAILNHARLAFKGGDDGHFTLKFEDNYCGEQECQDIQNKDGSNVSGLRDVSDLCDIGTQDIVA